MASYEVRIPGRVEKQLSKLSSEAYDRVLGALLALEEDPHSPNSIKLSGREGYRLQVGDYRALYRVDDEQQEVTVTRVGHRRDIYR